MPFRPSRIVQGRALAEGDAEHSVAIEPCPARVTGEETRAILGGESGQAVQLRHPKRQIAAVYNFHAHATLVPAQSQSRSRARHHAVSPSSTPPGEVVIERRPRYAEYAADSRLWSGCKLQHKVASNLQRYMALLYGKRGEAAVAASPCHACRRGPRRLLLPFLEIGVQRRLRVSPGNDRFLHRVLAFRIQPASVLAPAVRPASWDAHPGDHALWLPPVRRASFPGFKLPLAGDQGSEEREDELAISRGRVNRLLQALKTNPSFPQADDDFQQSR